MFHYKEGFSGTEMIQCEGDIYINPAHITHLLISSHERDETIVIAHLSDDTVVIIKKLDSEDSARLYIEDTFQCV